MIAVLFYQDSQNESYIIMYGEIALVYTQRLLAGEIRERFDELI